MLLYQFPYHSNREVVVDNAVGDRVSLLLLVIRDDIDVPAVQHHLYAVLNVPEKLQQAAPLIACPEEPEGKVQRVKIQTKEMVGIIPKSSPLSTSVYLICSN